MTLHNMEPKGKKNTIGLLDFSSWAGELIRTFATPEV